MSQPAETLEDVLAAIRACRHCAPMLPHTPRPVVRASTSATILIAGQAPGARVHASGIPWDDPSGDRLRVWMGLDRPTFYDEHLLAVAAAGFCFPGYDAKGGDLPPRRECAPLWRGRLLPLMPNIRLTLLVGGYGQRLHLSASQRAGGLTATVRRWAEFAPDVFVLPHPSWRNTAWLKANSWFEADVVPALREAVASARASAGL